MNGAQRTIPNPEAGGCLSLGALRSNPIILTRGVSNHNQLRPRCKHRAKFTSPRGTSPWHHWWPQPGDLKLKVSQHRSGKSSSTVKGKILSWKQGHSSQRWQAPKRTLASPFSLCLPCSPRCSVSVPRNQHQLLSLPSDPMFNPSCSPFGFTSLSTPSPTISPLPSQAP